MKKKIYVCPKHRDQVLFIEIDDPRRVEMLVPGRPEECPKCKKSYYKWECVEKN